MSPAKKANKRDPRYPPDFPFPHIRKIILEVLNRREKSSTTKVNGTTSKAKKHDVHDVYEKYASSFFNIYRGVCSQPDRPNKKPRAVKAKKKREPRVVQKTRRIETRSYTRKKKAPEKKESTKKKMKYPRVESDYESEPDYDDWDYLMSNLVRDVVVYTGNTSNGSSRKKKKRVRQNLDDSFSNEFIPDDEENEEDFIIYETPKKKTKFTSTKDIPDEELPKRGTEEIPLGSRRPRTRGRRQNWSHLLEFETSKDKFYEILGLKSTATTEEIRQSYRELARKWHPDRNPENVEHATQRFQEIQHAYQQLLGEQVV